MKNPLSTGVRKKIFVSGCYDLPHSGHVEFFRQAPMLGDLYVGIGSDNTILHYKNHRTVYPEQPMSPTPHALKVIP
ncbi:MAG: adenylyltransferase/cytidyltransferase family protein [Bacteroidales bacterium]|nr:adenylyltransferase/cytidyltransferase family protein [Bacteroidales bacterium]